MTEASTSAPPPVDDATRAAAEAAKDRANDAFKAKHFAEAVDGYSKAIALNPHSAGRQLARSNASCRSPAIRPAALQALFGLRLFSTILSVARTRTNDKLCSCVAHRNHAACNESITINNIHQPEQPWGSLTNADSAAPHASQSTIPTVLSRTSSLRTSAAPLRMPAKQLSWTPCTLKHTTAGAYACSFSCISLRVLQVQHTVSMLLFGSAALQ